MEVEFGLAVLAGRGLTAMMAAPDRARTLRWIAGAGGALIFITFVAITAGRAPNFHLGRNAPATILRAPELFLPPVVAAFSAVALFVAAARRQTATTIVLLVVLYLDLNLWGQFSGWRAASPTAQSELWKEPASLKFLREQANPNDAPPFRILTQDHLFEPDAPVSYAAPVEVWLPALEPDIPMMWGWANAGGYEGFGLGRYSRLAGDMKVWGDLTDPERTLRSQSRELDLLNVRYLLVRSPAAPKTRQSPVALAEIPATEMYGGQKFTKGNLGLPSLGTGDRIAFQVPPTEARRFAITSTLAWSETAGDGTVVARIRLFQREGPSFEFQLRAGEHTSEWAHDRADIQTRLKHKRAPVATSYVVEDAQPKFEGHDYVAAFELPGAAVIVGGEITVAPVAEAPRLALNVGRMSLINGDAARAIQKDWITVQPSHAPNSVEVATNARPRWKHLADIGPVAIFENIRALPRAWLVSSERIANDRHQLEIIRTGKVSADTEWQPLTEALVERSTGISFPTDASAGRAEITRQEPNRVDVTTASDTASLLVLADNFYPGWRAEVDGRPTGIVRVNYNQRGVGLTAGIHRVSFSYRPRSVLGGLLVSGVAFVLLLAWMNLRPSESKP